MARGPWLIRGGTLVHPEGGEVIADLRVDDGRIAAVGTALPADGCQVYDARGKHVFPGFIDPHVHLGNYRPFGDDCVSETIAAAAGGVTTIVQFLKVLQYRPAPTSYHEVLDEAIASFAARTSVDVTFHLALSTYEHMAEIPSYVQRGLTSFKFYLGYKGNEAALRRGTVGVPDDLVYAGFREIGRMPGAVALVHAENDELVRCFERAVADTERASFIEWANTRPALAEEEAVRRVCLFGRATGAPVYIVHTTSREALAAVREFRHVSPAPIYVETCPHYLVLDKDKANDLPGAMAKVIPPPRDPESREALWEGLASGAVDTVGSDHCAIELARKAHVWAGDPGFPGMETLAPLVVGEARRRGVPLARVAAVLAYNAARIFGLLPRKGTLRIGADADLAILDLSREWTIRAAALHSASDFTPYEGLRASAYVEATFLRGQLIWRDGQVLAPRQGQVVLRQGS